jgi:hypothetical protein
MFRDLPFRLLPVAFASVLLFSVTQAHAITLTFNDAISGSTTYSFDQDGDSVVDAVFSTTDPLGFNTVGPGPNMSYINEPGLEGTTTLAPDLRVDFPLGAVGSLGFGFAVSTGANSPNLTVTFRIYGSGGNLLASTTQLAAYTQPVPPTNSSYPEGLVSLPFSGVASYATFDFDNTDASRYIIDNFTGTFASTERPLAAVTPVPSLSEWGVVALSMLIAGISLIVIRRRN